MLWANSSAISAKWEPIPFVHSESEFKSASVEAVVAEVVVLVVVDEVVVGVDKV